MMYDVIIAGAGPSGLYTAKRLAEGGLSVLVLEKKNEIGNHVVCTGIISQQAIKNFSISRVPILTEIDKIKLVSPGLNTILYDHPYPFAYVLDREKHDKNLAQEALARGVKIELENEVGDIEVCKNRIEFSTKVNGKNHRKYLAKVGIIATGVNYQLHKKLTLGYPQDFLHGVQAEITVNNIDYTYLFVGQNIAAGAFAWLVPIGNNRARLGLMAEKNPISCFNHLVEKISPLKAEILDKDIIQHKAIAQGLVSKTYGERVLTVGEAAGQVKTSTGGGIFYGLLCSEIAAKVLIERFKKGNFAEESLAEYEKLWKKALQKEILIGYYVRKICAKLTDSQIETIFRIVKNDGVIPLIREKGNFDWHSDLILMIIKKLPLLSYLKRKSI